MANSIVPYLMESNFGKKITSAVFEAWSAIFEATNINKAYLIQQAGGEDRFRTARDTVMEKWNRQGMGQIIRNQNQAQKAINFLVLMEIRSPGFLDDATLGAIHDLATQNSLEQRFLGKVDSDTSADDAARLLTGAAEGAARATKVYPDLTPEEEEIWNRVKTYHEFETGFKWVYAVDASGKVARSIPSSITYKTMHHCGNAPHGYAGEGDQYYELRDSTGRAYLTVILDRDDCISESKSFGNQPNRNPELIKPYVKWFLRDKKVKGVGRRYDYGYAPDKNFGVKDFGDDPEFIEEIRDTKPRLLGRTERLMMILKAAIGEGIVTPKELATIYIMSAGPKYDAEYLGKVQSLVQFINSHPLGEGVIKDSNYGRINLFGPNGFAVMCGACGECPFTEDEIVEHAVKGNIELREFANYNVRLLTDRVQAAFVKAADYNFYTLNEIASQVGTFSVSPSVMKVFAESDAPSARIKFFDYLRTCEPKSKGEEYLAYIRPDDRTLLINMRRLDDAIAIDDRYPGCLGDLSAVCATYMVESLDGDITFRIIGALRTLAATNVNNGLVDSVADRLPDNFAVRAASCPGDSNGTIVSLLAKLGSRNPKFSIPDEWTVGMILKVNARAEIFSRQTKTILLSVLKYLVNTDDADKVVRYADMLNGDVYRKIYYERYSDGSLGAELMRTMIALLNSVPALFSAELVNRDGQYVSENPEDGRSGLARLYRGTDFVYETGPQLSPELIKIWIDANADTSVPKFRWVFMCIRGMGAGVDLSEYEDALLDLFREGGTAAEEMGPLITGGVVHVPMEDWDQMIQAKGINWVVWHLFAVLPLADVRDPDIYSEIIRKVLVNSNDETTGDKWTVAFQRACNGKGGLATKLRDRTAEIVGQLGNLSREAIQSLVSARVIRAADARKLLRLDVGSSGTGDTIEQMVLLSENIGKIEAKKRIPFLKAAFDNVLSGADAEHAAEKRTVINNVYDHVESKMMVPAYDDLIRYMASHADEIERHLHFPGTLRECAKYLNGERITDFYLSRTPFIKNAWARPDWATYMRMVDSAVNIDPPTDYFSGSIGAGDRDLEKIRMRPGRTVEEVRQAMPRIYRLLSGMTDWRLRYTYPHLGTLFQLI